MDLICRDDRENALSLPRPRVYRLRTCPFDTLTDVEFKSRYRFQRFSFFEIVKMMHDDVPGCTTNRSSPLTTPQKLAITIQTLASNSFQLVEGDLAGVAQSTISRTIKETTNWFVVNQHRFIMWPSKEENELAMNRIYARSRLPGIIGFIDGSHVRIIAPSIAEPSYVNRKLYHSLNISAIVNDKYEFIWLNTQYPGSAHDSRVFKESELHKSFVRGDIEGRIIGDSAYKAEPFLIKIHLGQNLSDSQQRYNNAVCSMRVHIEQSFGQLKRMFHALHGELRYAPERAAALIVTAVCLRNASIKLGDVVDELDDIPEAYEQPITEDDIDLSSGRATINSITDAFFA